MSTITIVFYLYGSTSERLPGVSHCHSRLTCDQNGAASEQKAFTTRYNRTVRTQLGGDKSIEGDLEMEHLNRYFKKSSKVSRGQLPDKTVERHALMLAVADETKELWEMGLEFRRKTGRITRAGKTRSRRWLNTSLKTSFILAGRCHNGPKFEGFIFNDLVQTNQPIIVRGKLAQHRQSYFLSRRMNGY